MLLSVLCAQVKEQFGKGYNLLSSHYRLSTMWARSVLGAKEKALAAFLLAGFFYGEIFNEQLMALSGALIGFGLWRLRNRYQLSLLVFSGWVLIGGVLEIGFATRGNPVAGALTDLAIARSVILILSTMFFLLVCQGINVTVLAVVCVLNAILTLLHYFFGPGAIGIIHVTSINSGFMACLLPIVPLPWVWLPLLAILVTQGHQAWMIAGIWFAWEVGKRSKEAAAALVALGIGCLTYVPFITEGRSRMEMYSLALQWWTQVGFFAGKGIGSWSFLGPALQHKAGIQPGEFFVALHSDWIQTLCETGIIGFALVIWVVVDFIRRNLNNPNYCFVVVNFSLFGVFYHPMRVPVIALCLAALVSEGLRRDG